MRKGGTNDESQCILLTKGNESDTDPYSTAYTMQELEYDTGDVKRVLEQLTVEDYIESMKDSIKPESSHFR